MPIHLQEVTDEFAYFSLAVAKASGPDTSLSTTVPTAVADASVLDGLLFALTRGLPTSPPGGSISPAELAVAEPAATAQPAAAEPEVAPVEEPVKEPVVEKSVDVVVGFHKDQVGVPLDPETAPLYYLHPALPATPYKVPLQGGNSSIPVLPPVVTALDKIFTRLMWVAREIRSPRSWVGYSAFVLMGLLKKCRPVMYEGGTFTDLLQVYVPWAHKTELRSLHVMAIACALKPQEGSSHSELVAVSDRLPLKDVNHFVAGIRCQDRAVDLETCDFETKYATEGVAVIRTVADGDCALDVMTKMLGVPGSLQARTDLRADISDYLMDRIGASWLHDIMVATCELDQEDVDLYRSEDTTSVAANWAPSPTAAQPAPAVAELEVVIPDEETFSAMRSVSKLKDDSVVLSLILSLPKQVVHEQVAIYRQSEITKATAGAVVSTKIKLGTRATVAIRNVVAHRFHMYILENDILLDVSMPYGAIRTFIDENIIKKNRLQSKEVRIWYDKWRSNPANVQAAVDKRQRLPSASRNLLKSYAPVREHLRKRAPGGGRQFSAVRVRQELYEWWSGLRYAIDWQELADDNRSRGKKHLARFPRDFIKLKANQLVAEYVAACLLNGHRVTAVTVDSRWFKRWEEEYGLSMRVANRKYEVSRDVVKQRMELFWQSLFRVRQLCQLRWGYDPVILNFDQSPFHHNESGSQNKATLAVRSSVVPIVEGKSDVKRRWSGNFTTQSRFDMPTSAVADTSPQFRIPPTECMFKYERDGCVDKRLQNYHRSRGFGDWFTVSVSPKGSYREYDVIEFLKKHLDLWTDGRDWRILLCDDYSAHKSENVWRLCWSRGYIRICHGGGVTPVAQTCDTDLNQHVRRVYGALEVQLLLEKMRSGVVVPSLTPEECMELLHTVMSNPALHKNASYGYKMTGQSIDLHGKEDALVCREAGVYWNEKTTCGLPDMRAKLNPVLALVAEEYKEGRLEWNQDDVLRLIAAYPANKKADKVLAALGEDFYHDDIHALEFEDDADAIADEDQEASASSAEDDDEPVALVDAIVLHGDAETAVADAEMDNPILSAEQADEVHKRLSTMATLEAAIELLEGTGQLRVVQVMQQELSKEKRKNGKYARSRPQSRSLSRGCATPNTRVF